jgi:hypothetical protein
MANGMNDNVSFFAPWDNIVWSNARFIKTGPPIPTQK